MNRRGEADGFSLFLLFVIGIIAGSMTTCFVVHDYHHDMWCIERLHNARSSTDTLKIVLDDNHCTQQVKAAK